MSREVLMVGPVDAVARSRGVLARIRAAQTVLVQVIGEIDTKPNATLVTRLKVVAPAMAVEVVTWKQIIGSDLERELLGCLPATANRPEEPPPGYYLAAWGKILGFHPASPTLDELKAAAAVGTGAGLLSGLFGASRPFNVGATFAAATWEAAAGSRAADYFAGLFERATDQERARRWREQQAASNDDFTEVCRILGVTANATKDEVNAQYKERAKGLHPDRQGGDLQQMKELNAARDLYHLRRGWGR